MTSLRLGRCEGSLTTGRQPQVVTPEPGFLASVIALPQPEVDGELAAHLLGRPLVTEVVVEQTQYIGDRVENAFN